MAVPGHLRTAKLESTAGTGTRAVVVALNPGETVVLSFSQVWDTSVAGKLQKIISTFDAGSWTKQGATIGWDSGTAHWRGEKWTCLVAPSAASITISFSAGNSTADAAVMDVYSGVESIGGNATTTGTSADPFLDYVTTMNDCRVHGTFFDWDITFIPTSKGTTNLRNTFGIGSGSDIAGGTTDNSRAAPGTLRNEVTLGAVNWGALVVELIPPQVVPPTRVKCPVPVNQRMAA